MNHFCGKRLNGCRRRPTRVLMDRHSSDAILMVRPESFGFHAEAAASNAFARRGDGDASAAAVREFDGLVQRLDHAGVEVLILDDQPHPPRPDAVFPNNWVSFHADGTLVLYPMATRARQLERNLEALEPLLASAGFEVREVVDLSFHERNGHYLEGTGSLVIDRQARRAFASLSPRTDARVIADFDDRLDYTTLLLDAHDPSGKPIYHTNVWLSLGSRFAMLWRGALDDDYRSILIDELEAGGRMVIDVDYDQMARFACNLIELRNAKGDPIIALSSAALACFRPDQRRSLEGFGELVDASIPTIEAVGGGSVRCMITDIHLPRKTTG
jgi:hypothetical protein